MRKFCFFGARLCWLPPWRWPPDRKPIRSPGRCWRSRRCDRGAEGTDKWEVARDAATKVTGDLKVGSKVTIEYTMTAKKIEVKEDKKADAKKKK